MGSLRDDQLPDEGLQQQQQQIHFVLVPLMAQGHIIPMVDLGRLLASGGSPVSIATTPLTAARIRPAVAAHSSINLVQLPFPTELTGLPAGCEILESLTSVDLIMKLMGALPLLVEPLKRYVQRILQEKAGASACIVVDFCLPWVTQVARDLGVPRYVLFPIGCFTMYCDRVLPGVYEQLKVKDDEKVVVPGLPHRVEINRVMAKGGYFGHSEVLAMDEAVTTADGVLVNTFTEMEPDYVEMLERSVGNKLWPVGPVSLCDNNAGVKAVRGDTPSSKEYSKMLAWLDSMTPKSVLYISFGTTMRPQPDQLAEIGAGLEDSGIPFLWVLKTNPEHIEDVDSWLASGFKDRITKDGRSFLVRGWAPQLLILSHPSVGGFLTHCGWNSTTEGITSGVPMITWPGIGDQFLNECFIVDVLGVGVRVGAEEPVYWFSPKQQPLIGRQKIAEAIRKVMDGHEGGQGNRMRSKVAEVADVAKKAMRAGGSSRRNLEALVEDAQRRAAVAKPIHLDAQHGHGTL